MTNKYLHHAENSVYPGGYVPLFRKKHFNDKTKNMSGHKSGILSVNIEKLESCYKVELPVPGVNRENFLINAYGNILTVSVIPNDCDTNNESGFQVHEFNFGCGASRKIRLPDDADPVFINAEYQSGVLRLYIPKSANPLKLINTSIAVY